MYTSKQFTVSFPKWAIRLIVVLILALVFLPVLFTLTQGRQHIFMYVIFGVMAVFSGFLWLHCIVFKVTVDGSSIHVRKNVFKKFSLYVSDIDRVDWIVSSTIYGQIDNIKLRAGSRKFGISTPLDHMDEMMAFLEASIAEDKFRKKIRNQSGV